MPQEALLSLMSNEVGTMSEIKRFPEVESSLVDRDSLPDLVHQELRRRILNVD